MVAIERLASLVVDARRMRRSGRYKLADMLRLEHAVLLGTKQLGLGGSLGAGYDIRAHNSRRSAARAGGSNRALQAFVEGTPTPGQSPESPGGSAEDRFSEGDR
jgi:hypothetical protein